MSTSYFARIRISTGLVQRVEPIFSADLVDVYSAVSVVDGDKYTEGTEWLWVRTWFLAGSDPAKRYNYAGIGYFYDASFNAFIATQPFPSWLLDAVDYQWKAPVTYPSDGKRYRWSEDAGSWIEV